MNREEVVNKASIEKVTLPFKITQAIWPGHDNLEQFISEDAQGNLHLKTVDENETAEMILAKNGFQISVSYLFMLPFKKP